MDAIVVELLRRIENDLRSEIMRIEGSLDYRAEMDAMLVEARSLRDEMRAIVAGLSSAASEISSDAAEAAEESAAQVAEEIGDAIADAVEASWDEIASATSETIENELPEMLEASSEEDSGPDRTPLFERKLFGN